jgi:hypothetical protein
MLAAQARRKTNKDLMFGDNSREALGLTFKYNKLQTFAAIFGFSQSGGWPIIESEHANAI